MAVQGDDGTQHVVSADHVLVACGLLDRQCTPQDRNMPALAEYHGHYTLAGRADGRDSLVGDWTLACKVQHCADMYLFGVCGTVSTSSPVTVWLWGQEVVIIGSGAFACEAMEAAAKAGAKKITMVTRERKR